MKCELNIGQDDWNYWFVRHEPRQRKSIQNLEDFPYSILVLTKKGLL